MRTLTATAVAGLAVHVMTAPASAHPAPSFALEEATIASVHEAFAAGTLSCGDLVDGYLRRISAYDQQGPALNTVISLNTAAQATAAELDGRYAVDGLTGPLHCIPVALKDNYDTFDLPTTGGAQALIGSIPPDDAFTVGKLRDAGAIILTKVNLSELARGGVSESSLGGQTRNPYDLTRTPGGSSGGTGSAVAANLAMLGSGSDTGQSTRSPASANSLVGIRSTEGLVSRDGIIPRGLTQDNAGQIARTAADAAAMLGVMAGPDPADPTTKDSADHVPDSYVDLLDAESLDGARIGVVEQFFGSEPINAEVNHVTRAAIADMEAAGATVVPVEITRLEELTDGLSVSGFETRANLDDYFAGLGPDAPITSFEDYVASERWLLSMRESLLEDLAVEDGLEDPEYLSRLERRGDLREALLETMSEGHFDALLYPHQRRLVATIGEEQLERNGVLSNGSGLPAVTFPGGFSAPTDEAPIGVPIGVELLGPAWSEADLLSLVHSFEQVTDHRKPPASAPPLTGGDASPARP